MPRLTTAINQPDAEEQALSQALGQRLRASIQADGPLSFADYMERCLYEPELGYYVRDNAIFGAGGDFVTAPEMGTLFAYGLARQISAVAGTPGWPADWELLEVGAGSGRLAADLITVLHALDCAPARYLLVERSPALRRRQQAYLAQALAGAAAATTTVVETVEGVPDGFRGVIIANEVLDALPVERVRLGVQGWRRLGVDWGAQGLRYCELPLPPELHTLLQQRLDDLHQRHQQTELPQPYTTEIHHAIPGWVQAYARALEQGVMLVVDYGYPRHEYYHPQRNAGSLICYYRHQAHTDALRWPGVQDLTAFVDFTTVAEAADDNGLAVLGYTSQAHFLLSSGVLDSLHNIDDPITMARLAEQARRLMLPGEMGERFQVMMLGKGVEDPGPGFEVDLRYRL